MDPWKLFEEIGSLLRNSCSPALWHWEAIQDMVKRNVITQENEYAPTIEYTIEERTCRFALKFGDMCYLYFSPIRPKNGGRVGVVIGGPCFERVTATQEELNQLQARNLFAQVILERCFKTTLQSKPTKAKKRRKKK